MRILLNIAISISFLLSTTGIFVSEHFCNNQFISVSFFSNAKKCCDGNCPLCHNVNHIYKVKTKCVQSEPLNYNSNNSFVSLFNLLPQSSLLKYATVNLLVVKINPPPGKSYSPIFFSKLRL